MVLASLDHSPIARLLLNDVGPAIAPESIRRIGEYLGRAPTFASIDEAEKYIRLVSAPFGTLTDAQWRHLTESSVRRTTDGRLEMGYDPAIADSFRRATADGIVDLWPVYDRIRCPTLLVRGAKSDLLTHETAQAMSSRGPHPQVVEVPEVGHAPMFMAADQIEIVERFFADLACSGAPSMPSIVGID
jgi:pimeloyl-ACP methyl ester carboxylesterase